MGHQQVNRHVIHMGQHRQAPTVGQRHQLARHRAVGVGAVVHVKLAQAPVGAGWRATRQLGLHHLVDAVIAEPVVVIGPTAVQAHKGQHRHAGLRGGSASLSQRPGAVVRPRVGQHRAHAIALHPRQHVTQRMRPGLAVPGFVVVVQVGVEQRAAVGCRLRRQCGPQAKCY